MKKSEHIEHSKQVLGEGFPQVHDYLDQYHDILGPEHRLVFHNPAGVSTCIVRWGYLAGAAACLHIWADEVGLIQANDGTFTQATIISPLVDRPDK